MNNKLLKSQYICFQYGAGSAKRSIGSLGVSVRPEACVMSTFGFSGKNRKSGENESSSIHNY